MDLLIIRREALPKESAGTKGIYIIYGVRGYHVLARSFSLTIIDSTDSPLAMARAIVWVLVT